jgi:RecA-family ATPase
MQNPLTGGRVMSNYNKKEILDKLDLHSYFSQHVDKMSPVKDDGETSCLCCFHKEKNPSLSINVFSGKYYCHKCKAKGDVFQFYRDLHHCDFPAALKGLAAIAGVNGGNGGASLEDFDVFDKEAVKKTVKKTVKKKEIARYDYTDEEGNLLFQAIRFEPKGFRQGHSENGRWIPNLKGVRRVPYRLHELQYGDEVLIFEGEKDVDLAVNMGFVATCNPMGAGKWKSEYNESLKDKKVFVFPDNDDPGYAHAEKIASELRDIASEVSIVDLPGLGDRQPNHGKDFTDWVGTFEDETEAGEKLAIIMDGAEPALDERFIDFPPFTSEQTRLSIMREPDPPEALIVDRQGKPIIIKGVVGELTAAGGTGKTYFLEQLAYELARGLGLGPLRAANDEGIEVLMLCGEDPQDEVERRLWAISEPKGEFPEKLHIASTVGHLGPLMKLEDNNPTRADAWYWLRETIKNHDGLELLIIDPKSRFYGLTENDNDHATQWIACLEALAEEFGITILFTHHISKASKGMNQNMSRGASAIVDGCRWVAGLTVLDEEASKRYGITDPRGYVIFDITKTNYSAGLKSKLIFKRGENGVFEYAALEMERRLKILRILYDSIVENPRILNKRSFQKAEDETTEIVKSVKEYLPKFQKKEIPKLIGDMIEGQLLKEVEVKKEGKGRAKIVLEAIPIDIFNMKQMRF